jgi:hypothetical protein
MPESPQPDVRKVDSVPEYPERYWAFLIKGAMIWCLFTTAVVRGSTVIGMDAFISRNVLLGIMAYSFLLYFLLKTRFLLPYFHFLFTVLSIVIVHYLVEHLINRYVALSLVDVSLSYRAFQIVVLIGEATIFFAFTILIRKIVNK